MRLRTLGGLALEGSTLTRPKPLLVLAYLALEGPTPRRRLAELFFADAADPRDSLSTALRHLRHAGVLCDGEGIDSAATEVPCDALTVLRSFDAYRYDDVLTGYSGAFLNGIDVDLHVEVEEWVFSIRETIAGRARAAALHEARRAVAERRLDEARAVASKAATLAEASDLEEDELAVLLGVAETLGMPEAARLRALARGMGMALPMAAVVAPRTSFGDTSLHRATRFIGRVEERARIDAALRDHDQRIVVIEGLGGIGKTRLMMRVLDDVKKHHAARFGDPSMYAALDGARDVAAAVSAIVTDAQLPIGAGASIERLAHAIGDRRAVLALDNVEQIEHVEDLIVALVTTCPHLFVLATSRRRLALHTANHVELPGLSTERPIASPEARTLFCDRAARAAGVVFDAESDTRVIDAICRRLDGHPLAVELAAAMLRAASLDVLEHTVERRLLELGAEAVDRPRRHHSVEALLETTWQSLDTEERRSLVRLAAFRGAFTYEVVRATTALGLRQLTRLVDVAVIRSQGGGRGRYALHPLVRAYARERATVAEWREARAAHLACVAASLEAAEANLERDPPGALDRLAALREDTSAAVEFALEVGDVAKAGAMLHTLIVSADLLQARGGDAGLVRIAVTTARMLRAADDLGTAEQLLTKAANATRTLLDDVEQSIALYEEALSIAETARDAVRSAALHSILAFVLLDTDSVASERHLARAQHVAQASGDPLAKCEVAGRTMYCAARKGDWPTARRVGYEVHAMLDELERTGAATRSRLDTMRYSCLHNLATAEDTLGDKDLALERRLQALAFAEARGHDLWQAHAHADLARHHHDAGATALGRDHFLEAARRFVDIGTREPLTALERDVGLVFEGVSHSGTSR